MQTMLSIKINKSLKEKAQELAHNLGVSLNAIINGYVKEFISGDNRRTDPSITSLLGTHCECMLLDVVEVCE